MLPLAMRSLTLALVSCLLAAPLAHAGPGPTVSIKQLVENADLIIVGMIPHVQTIGGGTVTLDDHVYDRLDFRAEIEVDEALKGALPSRHLVLDYSTPFADQAGNVITG